MNAYTRNRFDNMQITWGKVAAALEAGFGWSLEANNTLSKRLDNIMPAGELSNGSRTVFVQSNTKGGFSAMISLGFQDAQVALPDMLFTEDQVFAQAGAVDRAVARLIKE